MAKGLVTLFTGGVKSGEIERSIYEHLGLHHRDCLSSLSGFLESGEHLGLPSLLTGSRVWS